MNIWSSILFWVGIVLLFDATLALLFQERWKKWVGGLNIQRIAWIEMGLGAAILATHYILL